MTINEMTYKQGQALASFLHEIRPEWDRAGIEYALGKARVMAPAPDVAIAAIKAAKLASNRTPAIIGMEGPHWRDSATKPRYEQPDKSETCSVCSSSQAVCRSRWATDHEFIPLTQATAGRTLSPAEVRAKFAETKATLCRHLIDRDRAHCDPCDRAEKKPTPAPTEEEATA